MTPFFDYQQSGEIVHLTLNDPDSRNALSGEEIFYGFEAAVARMNSDLTVKAAVLTGAGSAFCSGGNVRDMRDKSGMFSGETHELPKRYLEGIQRIPLALSKLEVPIIAAINGPAIGAGLDLACMCDLRVGSERAIFAESFVKVGIVPGDGGAWLLPRVVGYSKALELALTGESIDAKNALAIGLISKVSNHDELMADALGIAEKITVNPVHVIRWTKRLMRFAQHARLEEVLELSSTYQALAHSTFDHSEAVAALLEKRKPQFRGQ